MMGHPLGVPEIFFLGGPSIKVAVANLPVPFNPGENLPVLARSLGLVPNRFASRGGVYTERLFAPARILTLPAEDVRMLPPPGRGGALVPVGTRDPVLSHLVGNQRNVLGEFARHARRGGFLSTVLNALFGFLWMPDIKEMAGRLGFRPYWSLSQGLGDDFREAFRLISETAPGYVHPYWRLSPEARRALAGL